VKQATNKEDPTFKCCVHFYACICAFASDPKLSEEFSYYINLDKPPVAVVSNPTPAEQQQHLVAILSDEDGTGTCEVEVEVLREEAALLEATGITVADDVTIAQVMLISVCLAIFIMLCVRQEFVVVERMFPKCLCMWMIVSISFNMCNFFFLGTITP